MSLRYRSIKTPPGQAHIHLAEVEGVARVIGGQLAPSAMGSFVNKAKRQKSSGPIKVASSDRLSKLLTRHITHQLKGSISDGTLAPGTRLPTEQELANSLKVARNVVRGSYENLIAAGMVKTASKKNGRQVRSVAKGPAKKRKTSASKKK